MRPTERLTAQHGALLVVDMQEKLLAAMPDRDAVIEQIVRLIRGAKEMKIPVWATEQYPRGLGPTVVPIAELVPERPTKLTFQCCAVPRLLEQLYGRHIRHVTVVGIEAHVCVAQTALELLDLGFRAQIPADAIASRNRFDWEVTIRRLEQAGATISTTEAVLFEWLESADRPEFKAISAMVKAAGDEKRS